MAPAKKGKAISILLAVPTLADIFPAACAVARAFPLWTAKTSAAQPYRVNVGSAPFHRRTITASQPYTNSGTCYDLTSGPNWDGGLGGFRACWCVSTYFVWSKLVYLSLCLTYLGGNLAHFRSFCTRPLALVLAHASSFCLIWTILACFAETVLKHAAACRSTPMFSLRLMVLGQGRSRLFADVNHLLSKDCVLFWRACEGA